MCRMYEPVDERYELQLRTPEILREGFSPPCVGRFFGGQGVHDGGSIKVIEADRTRLMLSLLPTLTYSAGKAFNL